MGERWWSAVECVAQWAGIFSPGVVTSPLSNDWGLVTAAGSVSSPRFRWVASPPPLPPLPPVPLTGLGVPELLACTRQMVRLLES